MKKALGALKLEASEPGPSEPKGRDSVRTPLRWLVPMLLAVLPAAASAASVNVLPKCGSPETAFILTASYPVLPQAICPGCPPACPQTIQLLVNGVEIPVPSPTGFENISEVLNLSNPGTYTVTLNGFGDCDAAQFTATTTFRVVDSLPSTWNFFTAPYLGVPEFHFEFIPEDTCGFPKCDRIDFIQVLKAVGYYPSGRSRVLTENDMAQATPSFYSQMTPAQKEYVDSLDAWTPPSTHSHIDLLLGLWHEPYYTQDGYKAQVGRIGPPNITAFMVDAPKRGDVLYPDSVSTIRLEFEINAFCSSGQGKGHFLGRATWIWERVRHSLVRQGTIVSGPFGDLEQPSPDFQAALDRYVSRMGFDFPVPGPP